MAWSAQQCTLNCNLKRNVTEISKRNVMNLEKGVIQIWTQVFVNFCFLGACSAPSGYLCPSFLLTLDANVGDDLIYVIKTCKCATSQSARCASSSNITASNWAKLELAWTDRPLQWILTKIALCVCVCVCLQPWRHTQKHRKTLTAPAATTITTAMTTATCRAATVGSGYRGNHS